MPKNLGKRVPKKKIKKQDLNIDEPLSDGGSLDPRERLMGMKNKRAGGVRPVSNQLDRFGRIAFNKNKEPSQASLDVSEEDKQEEDLGPAYLLNN